MPSKPVEPMPTRREIIQAFAVLSAGSILPAMDFPSLFSQTAESNADIHFGAQTNAWAIHPNNFESFLYVLAKIRQIGYSGFETGFVNVMSQFVAPEQAQKHIAKSGLTFFGMHVFLPVERYDAATGIPPASLYERLAPGALSLGAKHLIFSGLPVRSDKELRNKIAGLNAAGKYCMAMGLPLAYHNEKAQESRSKFNELEVLYQQTDPEYVSFLLDCGHAYEGGADVPAFLQKYHQRIIGLHLRDYNNGTQVPLGQGSFPLMQVAATMKQLHWKGWVLNEEERLDGSKYGSKVMKPAYQAMEGAFSA